MKILILWAICLSEKMIIIACCDGTSRKDCHVSVAVTEYRIIVCCDGTSRKDCHVSVAVLQLQNIAGCWFISLLVFSFLPSLLYFCFASALLCLLASSFIRSVREGLYVCVLLCQVLIIHVCAVFWHTTSLFSYLSNNHIWYPISSVM